MYKKSIAKNHLSDLASKGRYGDTEIARTSKGELWHVNPQEKALIDMYGMEGEKMVDAMGSGTINPETGLEEKWVQIALGVANLAVAGYGAWKSGKEQSRQARHQSKLSEEQLQKLDEAESKLDPLKESQEMVARREFEQNLGDLSLKVGQSKEELKGQFETTIQKSGMANVAGGKMSTMYKNIQNQFGRGQQSLMGQLGKTMAGIEERYESEQERIKSERKRLSLQKSYLRKQADSWYLGKHAETVAKAGGLGLIPALINPGGD